MTTEVEDSKPLLSILIPTHDRKPYLLETLDHLFAHLPAGVEVIVIDDASSDGTEQAVRERYPSIVYLRSEKRAGPGVARNHGLERSRGEYFMPLDSDCFIVPETLSWLLQQLRVPSVRHRLFPCRSWPGGSRSVEEATEGDYSYKDILLKTYGEVIPVLATDSLRRLNLGYPNLFAGGEPLLFLEISLHETLHFVDRVILEYRTDLPNRISSTEYQLAHSRQIAEVFEAYFPFLAQQTDPDLAREYARVLEKSGVYSALAGDRVRARKHLSSAVRRGRISALVFYVSTFLPSRWLAAGFAALRRVQSLRRKM